MTTPPLTATISPARIVSRAKSPRPSIGLVRFSVLGLSQLLMVGPSRVRSERLPELKHVAVVVVDRKLPHPVLEVLHRIADARPGLEPLPQAFDVVGLDVQRSGEGGSALMAIRRRDHDGHAVAAEGGASDRIVIGANARADGYTRSNVTADSSASVSSSLNTTWLSGIPSRSRSARRRNSISPAMKTSSTPRASSDVFTISTRRSMRRQNSSSGMNCAGSRAR